jgi:hypothetical protein
VTTRREECAARRRLGAAGAAMMAATIVMAAAVGCRRPPRGGHDEAGAGAAARAAGGEVRVPVPDEAVGVPDEAFGVPDEAVGVLGESIDPPPGAAGVDREPVGAPADPSAGPGLLDGASFRLPVTTPSPSSATVTAVLAPGACRKELERRKLPFARSKSAASNVATPLRSTGPLNGVRIVIPRAPSPYGVLDCRLALALDEMTKVLAEAGVVEVQIDNTHRPGAKLPRRGAGKSQHAYGLAADVTRMKLADGTQLRVDEDWGAPIGAPSCGPEATMDPVTPEAVALRDIVCELARRGVFHHVLTPGYNAAHRSHLHLDIKRGEKRTRVR